MNDKKIFVSDVVQDIKSITDTLDRYVVPATKTIGDKQLEKLCGELRQKSADVQSYLASRIEKNAKTQK